MGRYILYRLGRALITLILFQTVLFLLIHALPGDFVSTAVGLPPVWKKALRVYLGLHLPLWRQYLRWMEGFFTGNLGKSFLFPRFSVAQLLIMALPKTLLLLVPATVSAWALGVWLGKVLAWPPKRSSSAMNAAVTALAVSSYSSFLPWVMFMLIQIFAIRLKWFPAQSETSLELWAEVNVSSTSVMVWMLITFLLGATGWWVTGQAGRRWKGAAKPALRMTMLAGIALAWVLSGWARLALDIAWHLALPFTALLITTFGEIMLLMRTSMSLLRGEDFVLMARAKGLPDTRIRDDHMSRIAILPLLSRFMLQLPFLLLGSFVVEKTFFWPGVGALLFFAIDYQDVPLLMGILSLTGVLLLLAHIALDIAQAWIDPRLRGKLYGRMA